MRASPLLLANCETPIYAVKIVRNLIYVFWEFRNYLCFLCNNILEL